MGRDIETSGGGAFASTTPNHGLTIFEVLPSGAIQDTLVYHGDESVPNATATTRTGAPPIPFPTPGGVCSRDPSGGGHHTRGDFPASDDNTFAENTFIDTFVYGRSRQTTTPAQITTDPNGKAGGNATGYATIDAATVGGDAALPIGDAGLDNEPNVPGTLGNGRGDTLAVTLDRATASGPFTAFPPSTGTAGSPNDDGTISVAAGEIVRIDCVDAIRANGATNRTVSDIDTVRSGTPALVAIDATIVGSRAEFFVTNGDRTVRGSLEATARNGATGESETVALIERSGSPGTFDGAVGTRYRDPSDTAGNPAPGTFDSYPGDAFRIVDRDVARPSGAPGFPTPPIRSRAAQTARPRSRGPPTPWATR